jgi:hypothetical protein
LQESTGPLTKEIGPPMAERNRTGSSKPPADKTKTYNRPHEEERSPQTQAAADRYLPGTPQPGAGR